MFLEEAKKYQVLPLDASVAARVIAPRPNITAGRTDFVYTSPMVGLPQGDSPLLLNTSYTITADIEVLEDTGTPEEREVEVLTRSVITQFENYVKLSKKVPPEILTSLSGIDHAGRLADTVLMRLADMIMVMPTLLVVLILSSLFGQLRIWTIVVLIALFRWPGISRVIRAQTLTLKHRPFIEAARVAGASHLRIIFRHIFPNVLPLALLYMTFRVTSAIIIEAALAFLGFGDPGTVSWGMMLQWVWKTGHMFQAPYWLLPPGLCISLLTLSFYMLGRAMEEVLDPRLRREGEAE